MAKKKDRIEIYKSRRNGQYGWRFKAGGNNATVAISGELYKKIFHANKMVRRLFGSEIEVEYVGTQTARK